MSAHRFPPSRPRALPQRTPGPRLALLATALLAGLALPGCGGGDAPAASTSREDPAAILPEHVVHTEAEAARFLTQATYGPTEDTVKRLKDQGYGNWLATQFVWPRIDTHWDYVARMGPIGCMPCESKYINATMESFWMQVVMGGDQLRQRMVLALSELFVVSTVNSSVQIQPDAHAAYLDMLSTHAFGNFRDLLEAVTRHPTMGHYLSHIKNVKENPATGQTPDENYAREVMQLFTIGLWQLDEKGRRLKNGNQDIPSYDLDDVMGMARVLTGLSWADPDGSATNWHGWKGATWNQPMVMYPEYHSQGAKVIKALGVNIPARTGTETQAMANADLKLVLDALFNHPNTPAFIGRQLIQRFVTSNPSDDYVGRVADAFRNNGKGVRGDMKAVITAVLLDPEARSADKLSDPQWGKLREPMVRFGHFLRVFNASSPNNVFPIWNLEDPVSSLGQNPLRAPSVFNWFQPSHSPPGALADANLVAPEFQITHETTLTGYYNFMGTMVERQTAHWTAYPLKYAVRYDTEIGLAATPGKLIERLDLLLLNGQMQPGMRADLLSLLSSVTKDTYYQSRDLTRTELAIALLMSSPQYIVQK
ncbi:MAG: hypothetical protein RLZZ182_1651 [Pseudomonadota bacterium]